MFKFSQEEIDKMKEEVKELKKKIDRLEWFIKINEYNANEHKVYEGGSDLHLNYEGTKERKNIIGVQQTETSDNIEYNKVDSYSKVIGKVKKQSPFDTYESPFEYCKNSPNSIDENRWTNNKTPKQIEDEYNKNMNIIYAPPFECCKDCPNNFKNNPSSGGVCSCDLPYHEMFRW